jgi:SAM-dependent methyltransferase
VFIDEFDIINTDKAVHYGPHGGSERREQKWFSVQTKFILFHRPPAATAARLVSSNLTVENVRRRKTFMEQPQIWHYGLVALASAHLWMDSGEDRAYFQQKVETYGQPSLDLGCGSGRILLPLLRSGLDVHGCDYSQDMLAQLDVRLHQEGLSTRLFHQSMHELDLPHRYRTIYACGVIGLGGESRLALEAMQRCYDHLRPGGAFIFDYSPRWNDPPAWLNRLPEGRHANPSSWQVDDQREPLPGGYELEISTRTLEMDPLENVATRQMRCRLWKDGAMVKEEIHTQKVGDFSKNELVLMLERAGFLDIQVNGEYCDQPATADDPVILFLAKK